jgi:hypothetical protein
LTIAKAKMTTGFFIAERAESAQRKGAAHLCAKHSLRCEKLASEAEILGYEKFSCSRLTTQ